MSKHYSRDRSPLSPVRYERTAGHSRSAKSPISISKPYSSDSYKGLNSYRGDHFDKYPNKKYSKHDNGYKNLLDSKYDRDQWRPKDDYKMDSVRKHDYNMDSHRKNEYNLDSHRKNDYKLDSHRKNDYKLDSHRKSDYKLDSQRKNEYKLDNPRKNDYKLDSPRKHSDYKDSYKKPLRSDTTKYDKVDYKRPLNRERSPKYDKDYFKDFKIMDKDKFSKKSDYRYKEFPSGGSFKSETRYKDEYYYKESSSLSYKDSLKKIHYSSPNNVYPKPLGRISLDDRSYKDANVYVEKRYDDYLTPKSYDKFGYKDKYYGEDFDYGSKYTSKGFKDVISARGPADRRKNTGNRDYDSYLIIDEYSPRNNNSYERYVIGDSVVYGSPGHQPQEIYSPNNRISPLNDLSSVLSNRTIKRRYSLTPPRLRRNDVIKKNSRLSPLSSKRPLSPLFSKNNTGFTNRKNRDDFIGDRRRSSPLKSPQSTSRRLSKSNDRFKSPQSKGRGASPPKPLLSIRLPAGSIPRASRMHIDQTVSINDQVGPRERRPVFGRRLDGRLGRAESDRTRDRPTKASDLRLWIESRKNVNRKAAKVFPAKDKLSRRENLSEIANRVRLQEARKRALESRGTVRRATTRRMTTLGRSKSTRNAPVPSARPPSNKLREPRKRSKSPIRKSLKRPVPERRRTLVGSRTTKSTTMKRTSSRTNKLLKTVSKSAPSRRTRRSPARTKRRSSDGLSSKKKEHSKN